MAGTDYDCDTINSLIKTTIDSADGYRHAAEDAKDRSFQSMFFQCANEREAVVNRLQEYVRGMQGTPAETGSMAAGAHRMFMGLREAVTGNDDESLVAEVERGEDYIKEKYEAAQADEDLSTSARSVVSECFQSIKAGHDQMRDLKHSMEGGMQRDMRGNMPSPDGRMESY
jgi:uncharacterized protein (TIGR02284 family)